MEICMNPRIKTKGEEPGVCGRRSKSQFREWRDVPEAPALTVQESNTVPRASSFPSYTLHGCTQVWVLFA